MDTKRSVIVTGAGTGIGRATVEHLLHQGMTVFGSVRSDAAAEKLQRELGNAAFTPLVFDVTDEGAVAAGVNRVREALGGRYLAGLVNNAGIAVGGPLAFQPMEEIRAQFDVNVFGLLIATRAFLPLLGMDPGLRGTPGRIVNISSVAGKLAAPFVGAYVGTKHAVEGLSDSLRRELMPFGIDVVVIGPGAVATPIWDKAEAQDDAMYVATPYAETLRRFQNYFIDDGRRGLPPSQIAEAIGQALTAPRPRVRYAVVPQRLVNWSLPMILPKRVADRVIAARLKMRRGFT